MTEFTYSQMGEAPSYLVIDAKNSEKVYATFSLLDASRAAPPAYKHLDMNIQENVAQEILENGDISLLMDILSFVFAAVINITHEEKEVKLCKIHSHGFNTRSIYQMFADQLNNNYEVKSYGKWIEIFKK